MPISFACPHCNRNYQVADQMAGKAVKCQACQNAIHVPSGQPAAAAAKIAFSCSSCGKAYQVGPEMAGKAVRCQACQNVVQVPGGAAATQPQPQPQTAATEPITFACQSCGRQYQVAGSMAGKQAQCQSCQAVMHVPSAAQSPIGAAAGGGMFAGGSSIFDEVTEGDLARWHGKKEEEKTFSAYSEKPQAAAWKDGKYLVVRNGGKLPNRCIKTNQAAEKHVSVKLTYTPPWVYLMWFVCGWLAYAIVASQVSKRATIEYAVSDGPSKRYWTWALVGAGLIFGGFGLGALFVALGGEDGSILTVIGVLLGAMMFFAGCIIEAIINPFIKVKYVNEQESHVWIDGVNQAYLGEFPPWDQGRPF